MAVLNFRGEIAGIVKRHNKDYLLLDSLEPLKNSKKYKLGYISLIEMDKKNYKKLENNYTKHLIKLKNSAYDGKEFLSKKQKIFNFEFEAYADKPFFRIMNSHKLTKAFKEFYKENKGANCLNKVEEHEVRLIEGLGSKNKDVVEETIEKLGKIRKKLSEINEWKKKVDKEKLKIALIFPYYNEPSIVANIRAIYNLVEEGIIKEIIIADGWSTNPSVKIVEERLDIKFPVVKNPGLGKGGAIESAIKYALYLNFDLVICLDSDIIPPLHIVRDIPPLPIDITCDFFARKFIDLFFTIIKKYGKKKALETYYKASYMRIPKKADSLFPLRFGGTTVHVKKFYKSLGLKVMKDCVYPLAGEYAFNPKFLIENITISKEFFDMFKKKYTPTIPSGFTIENFWNITIEAKGLNIAFANMFIHHHIPRGAKVEDKLAYAKQRGTVFRGGYGAMLQSIPQEEAKKYIKNFDFELYRLPRPKVRIKNGNVLDLKFVQ